MERLKCRTFHSETLHYEADLKAHRDFSPPPKHISSANGCHKVLWHRFSTITQKTNVTINGTIDCGLTPTAVVAISP